MHDILPPELEKHFGHLQYVRKRGINHWTSECPKCGSLGHKGNDYPDRFCMWVNPTRVWCRVCSYSELVSDHEITEQERQEFIRQRQEQQERELRAAKHAIAMLQRERRWLWYQKQVGVIAEWWESKGITEELIDKFHLGYCPSKRIWVQDKVHKLETATIPVFDQHWRVVNIRHRILHPIDEGDKYRPERGGLPTALYRTERGELKNSVLLVEGEIKSIVLWDRLKPELTSIVGTPGKANKKVLSEIQNRDRVIVLFDPDAQEKAEEAAMLLRTSNSKVDVVEMDVKPDDWFVVHNRTRRDFIKVLNVQS